MEVSSKWRGIFSVPPENVPRIYFVPHVIQACVVAVGDDWDLNSFKSFTTRLPKKVLPSARVGS